VWATDTWLQNLILIKHLPMSHWFSTYSFYKINLLSFLRSVN
jgi:hypothetical protein